MGKGFRVKRVLGLQKCSYSRCAKKVCKKICTFFSSELAYKSGVMRGFQKGITLGGRASGSLIILGLQKWVAKKFAKFWHLFWDSSWGS